MLDLPPLGWIKINFDGAVGENNVAGLGCNIRNSSGNLMAPKGEMISSHTVGMVELRSVRIGLETANEFLSSITGIIIERDSTFVQQKLNLIPKGIYTRATKSNIATVLKEMPRVQLSLIEGSAHKAADYISKRACFKNCVGWRIASLSKTFGCFSF